MLPPSGPMLAQTLVLEETLPACGVGAGVLSLVGDGASVGGSGVAIGAAVEVGPAIKGFAGVAASVAVGLCPGMAMGKRQQATDITISADRRMGTYVLIASALLRVLIVATRCH